MTKQSKTSANDFANLDADTVATNRIPFTKNHFGFSREDDDFVTSSDEIYVNPGEGPYETYVYEKEDQIRTFTIIIDKKTSLEQRLKTETSKQKTEKIQKVLSEINSTLLRNKELVKKIQKT